jgi:spermidine/putrescine transport system ATP-binding protein
MKNSVEKEIDVSVDNLTKKFGLFTAVDEVNFSVPRGEFFSILGPSGCGKTTLLRMISGFEVPTQGDIYIGGARVNDIPPNKRRTNLIFQNLALFPLKSVYENIAFGLRRRRLPKDEIRKKVSRMLERVGLPGFENKAIHQLSGGQKQRVAIARCLVLDPTVLLLDEPLGALDLKHRVGTTFIYITHDQGEAMTMSDNIAVMLRGRIEQIGKPHNLYNNPATSFVAAFVGDSNRFQGEVVSRTTDSIKARVGSLEMTGVPQLELLNEPDTLIFVRPQNILINPQKRDLSNEYQTFPGVVKNVIFEGSTTTYVVEIAKDMLIKVVVPQASHVSILGPMEKVSVAWKVSDTFCFSTKKLEDIDMSVGGEGT